ncbi:hypothetical protein HJC23_010517 [Cyclotella cryptica]|uniref:Gfo/Idh/MocA-like oxidoreductase N-terminal domain-containing protein n=1 Tax=Cyclotella cryptica TaxID=29204 RepID=A0ABD3QD33_9STRA
MSNDNSRVKQNPLSIGILGAARIAKKNCRAASHPSTSCEIVAVASRSKEKGENFVSEVFGTIPSSAPIIYGGDAAYSNLIRDKSCDAVYVPLPTKLHKQYVISALDSGKHVLLEKPVANSADEYRQMLVAASKKAFVKSIPNPTRVHFNFTFDGDINFHQNDIRTKKDGDFMGCIGDLGWYCARMGLLVFSGADAGNLKGLVTDVQTTRYELNDDGVPMVAECIVHFTDNRVLSFHCSFVHPLNQTVQISASGSEYTAIETDAILPFVGDKLTFTLVKQNLTQFDEIVTADPKVVECDNTMVQEVCMWSHFNEWARMIEQESSSESSKASVDMEKGIWWAGDSSGVKEANAIASYSLLTQTILDGLMESVRSGGSIVKVCS